MADSEQQRRIKTRAFLVGCPRSGTTVMQSALATHRDLATFPESKLFLLLERSPRLLLRHLGVVRLGYRKRFCDFASEAGYAEGMNVLPRLPFSVAVHGMAAVSLLDTLALSQGANTWLEKTPLHLQRVSLIREICPDSKFIHIIRNPLDTIASLYEATNRFPDGWGGPKTLDWCVSRWIDDVETSMQCANSDGHIFICYETFVEHVQQMLRRLAEFLDVDENGFSIEHRTSLSEKLMRDDEVWKKKVYADIAPQPSKVADTFSQRQTKYVADAVAHVNYSALFNSEVV